MGKETLRITAYYASLLQEDAFHPVMLSGEKLNKRLDPFSWQSVPAFAIYCSLILSQLQSSWKEQPGRI